MRRAFGAFVLLALLSLSGLARGQSEYSELADRHGLQQTFPDGKAVEPDEIERRTRPVTAPRFSLNGTVLLVLAGLVIAVFAVFVLRNAQAFRRENQRFKAREEKAQEVEVWGTVPDDSWEALVNRLRLSPDMGFALHEMLLAAIGYCQQELSIHIPRANTPREIQQGLPAEFSGAEDFETLVQGAELAWFGEKPVDRPMFQRGLDALERIIGL